MKIGKIIISGIVVGILKSIWGALTCGWLFNWVYKLEPTNIWKSFDQMSFPLMNISNIVFGVLLALVYALINKCLPGKGIIKGLWFGLFVWLVGALPGTFSLGLVTVMAHKVVTYWIINFFIVSLWQGLLISAIYGKDTN